MSNKILGKELQQLMVLIDHLEISHSSISKATIGWHLDHSLQVISSVCKAIIKSDSSVYRYKRNNNRMKIRVIGYIPRGIGKAPEVVTPKTIVERDDLLIQLKQVRTLLIKLDTLSAKHFFKHPVFGGLNKKRTIWFLNIHTRHHLKIMNDIIKASKV